MTTSCKSGDIVDVPFPFVDRPARKRRPALVLSAALAREEEVLILAMITSAKRSRWSGDIALSDWRGAGLRAPSVLRWKIFTIDAALVVGRRGSLSTRDRELVSHGLHTVFSAFVAASSS